MTRTRVLRIAAGIVFLFCTWIAYTQNTASQPPQLKVNKIKEDLYEIEGDGGNVAVYITDEGLILVDDKFDRDHDAIVTQIKSFSNLPVKYIFSTHYHEDHSGGNGKFLSTAEIISTANARADSCLAICPCQAMPPAAPSTASDAVTAAARPQRWRTPGHVCATGWPQRSRMRAESRPCPAHGWHWSGSHPRVCSAESHLRSGRG